MLFIPISNKIFKQHVTLRSAAVEEERPLSLPDSKMIAVALACLAPASLRLHTGFSSRHAPLHGEESSYLLAKEPCKLQACKRRNAPCVLPAGVWLEGGTAAAARLVQGQQHLRFVPWSGTVVWHHLALGLVGIWLPEPVWFQNFPLLLSYHLCSFSSNRDPDASGWVWTAPSHAAATTLCSASGVAGAPCQSSLISIF